MQFSRSLQICLFASFTILVGIAPLVFLVGCSDFMILEMSSALTKLKSNNSAVSTDLNYAWMQSATNRVR